MQVEDVFFFRLVWAHSYGPRAWPGPGAAAALRFGLLIAQAMLDSARVLTVH